MRARAAGGSGPSDGTVAGSGPDSWPKSGARRFTSGEPETCAARPGGLRDQPTASPRRKPGIGARPRFKRPAVARVDSGVWPGQQVPQFWNRRCRANLARSQGCQRRFPLYQPDPVQDRPFIPTEPVEDWFVGIANREVVR